MARLIHILYTYICCVYTIVISVALATGPAKLNSIYIGMEWSVCVCVVWLPTGSNLNITLERSEYLYL